MSLFNSKTVLDRLKDLLPKLRETITSRQHLRTKVTPDFPYHLNGDIEKDKKWLFSTFLHSITGPECALESPRQGYSIAHPRHMVFWRFYINLEKKWSFGENSIHLSTETFAYCSLGNRYYK